MAVPVGGRVLLDTNVFIDYLRAGMHTAWVLGSVSGRVRFLSSVVLFELSFGADSRRRRLAVERIRAAFPAARQMSPSPLSFERAGRLFPLLHGRGPGDRLGRLNDLLIGLTAREIGATVVTRNLEDFARVATVVPGLAVTPP